MKDRKYDRVLMTISQEGKVRLFSLTTIKEKIQLPDKTLFPDMEMDLTIIDQVFLSMIAAKRAAVLDGSWKMIVVKDRMDHAPRIERIK